jgi:hypothetical protein
MGKCKVSVLGQFDEITVAELQGRPSSTPVLIMMMMMRGARKRTRHRGGGRGGQTLVVLH